MNTLPSGKTFSHAVRVEPLRDSDGRVQCFQATSSNIVQMNDSGVGARGAAACPPAGSASASRQLSTGAMQMASGERGNSSGFKRTSSDLKISEMLDLFEKHEQNGASPMVTSSTNQKSPSHLALDTLPEGRESLDGVAGGGGAAGGYEPSAAAKAMMAAGGLGAPPPPADPSAGAKAYQLAMSEAKAAAAAAAAAPSAAPPNSPEAMRRGGGSDKGSPEGDIDRLVSVEGA